MGNEQAGMLPCFHKETLKLGIYNINNSFTLSSLQ
jgi:hypothetical protein